MATPDSKTVTCTGPVNIAVIKYWGKRDGKLILPINASLSGTLDQDELCAKTSIMASSEFTGDRMWLNGEEQNMENPRLHKVLSKIRDLYMRQAEAAGSPADMKEWGLRICSENNFPTAAGLASSAAGYACLVFTLAKLYGIQGDISEVARLGSGSACRSVLGGFVAWNMGTNPDGSDSLAEQIVPESHWPEMRVLILVVNVGKKHTPSTSGMQTSVETSLLLQERVRLVPRFMQQMIQAIKDRNFSEFATLTMKDSNQLHAVCLDTYPPISYMTDVSRDIQRLCHAINAFYGENRVAYTFDAGPNACLYLLEKDVPVIMSIVKHVFPNHDNGDGFLRGPQIAAAEPPAALVDSLPVSVQPRAIKYVIHTRVGPGPQVIEDPNQCLLDSKGNPKAQVIASANLKH